MKIHGTAKGGAISKKDFGVAFGGGDADDQHYSTDFSSHGDWSENTSKLGIDTTANRLNFDLTSSGIDQFMNYDLSTMDVSNTEWLLRYECYWSKMDLNASDQTNKVCVGCYSDGDPSGTTPEGDALRYTDSPEPLLVQNVLASINNNVETKTEGADDPFSDASTGTTYYIEIKRVSEDSLEQRVYSTPDYSTTQVGTTMTVDTSSGVNNTQFLTVNLFSGTITGGGGQTGYINQLDFWNGVTTPP